MHETTSIMNGLFQVLNDVSGCSFAEEVEKIPVPNETTSIMNGLFQVLNAVSGCSFAEEVEKTTVPNDVTQNPFTFENGGVSGWIS